MMTTVMVQPVMDDDLATLMGASSDVFSQEEIREIGLLPRRRGESWTFRLQYGWTVPEIDRIVALLQGKAAQLRQDAASLQAHPMAVVNPSDPWGTTLAAVGDVDTLRYAERVESLATQWTVR